MNLFDLGERKIIEELKKLYGTIVDDDSYYFAEGKDYILITTDVITKKTHIPDDVSPELAGYFFASLNFSDIAAMGGRPKYFLTSYSMRIDTDFDFFMEFNRGIKKCIKKYKTKMVGGDTKEGDDFTATGIAVGKVNRNYILLRKNFKEDQVVAVISLNFGGDYELLFSVDRSKWQNLKEKMEKNNFKVSEIGETWKGENILVKEGKEVKIKYHGYEHFTRSTLL